MTQAASNVVIEKVSALLKRSFAVYRQGEYMAVLGDPYAKYVMSSSTSDLVSGVLGKPEYKVPLVAAFTDHEPRDDEIYLYACKDSMVLTSQRLFLLNGDGLTRQPIDVATIKQCKDSGFWLKKLELELANGDRVTHEGPEVVGSDAILKTAAAALDPASRKALRRPPDKIGEEPSTEESDSDARRSGQPELADQDQFVVETMSAEEALSQLDSRKHDREVVSLNDQAAQLIISGEFDAARQLLNRAVELNPQYGIGFVNISASYMAEERWDEAVPWLEKALAVHPGVEGAAEALELCGAKTASAESEANRSAEVSTRPMDSNATPTTSYKAAILAVGVVLLLLFLVWRYTNASPPSPDDRASAVESSGKQESITATT